MRMRGARSGRVRGLPRACSRPRRRALRPGGVVAVHRPGGGAGAAVARWVRRFGWRGLRAVPRLAGGPGSVPRPDGAVSVPRGGGVPVAGRAVRARSPVGAPCGRCRGRAGWLRLLGRWDAGAAVARRALRAVPRPGGVGGVSRGGGARLCAWCAARTRPVALRAVLRLGGMVSIPRDVGVQVRRSLGAPCGQYRGRAGLLRLPGRCGVPVPRACSCPRRRILRPGGVVAVRRHGGGVGAAVLVGAPCGRCRGWGGWLRLFGWRGAGRAARAPVGWCRPAGGRGGVLDTSACGPHPSTIRQPPTGWRKARRGWERGGRGMPDHQVRDGGSTARLTRGEAGGE